MQLKRFTEWYVTYSMSITEFRAVRHIRAMQNFCLCAAKMKRRLKIFEKQNYNPSPKEEYAPLYFCYV